MEVDFANSQAPLDAVCGRLSVELGRIHNQLSRGYLFESDKNLPEDKRQVVDGYVTEDGTPTFQSYKADIKAVVKSAEYIRKAYGRPSNVVVIGNGGSITGAESFYNALIEYSKPGTYAGRDSRLYVVDSQEPGPIARIRRECPLDDTVVLPISKSGNTQSLDDVLDVFIKWKYNLAAVTTKGGKVGRLYGRVKEVLSKRGLDAEKLIVDHPPIGGRYTGRTPVSTLPLALLGMSEKHLKGLDDGAKKMYSQVNPKVQFDSNPALKLAAALHYLELEKGCAEIFAPMYSHALEGFAHLTTQLLHESSCKLGRGQTILTSVGPECQHHTTQRFFGGRRDMAAVFFTVDQDDSGLKTSTGVPLEKALQFEYEGTRDDATKQGIPTFTVKIDELTPKETGGLLAFLQYAFGVYPSLLRDVNPFDQPQVENSKHISRELREKYLKRK
ncbi:MAG: hypothetical protein V1744_02345 [Candidatus Altiarchaeota archaeon]